MFNLKSAFLGLFSAILISNLTYADEIGAFASLNNNPHTIYTTQGLKPISNSYKLAKLQFLPDLKDSENGWAGNNIGSAYNKNDCSAYPLKSCPLGATCVKCPFAKKYKLTSCRSGWKISGNTCVAASCSALNSSYLSTVPDNKICSKINEGGLTCFKECRNISCNDYKINCDNGVSGANITSSALCPDCQNANAKCSPKLCKITACATNYKTNADNTACVEKSDVCPNNYFKTCETSIVGEPEYTERGTACYQCKAKEPETCSKYVEANFPNYTRIGSSSDLQHALIDGKNNFVVVNDFTLAADVDLSGKTIMGANEIASASPLCATKRTITANNSIKTNNTTTFKNLKIASTKEGKYGDEGSIISGGGNFYNIELSTDKYYTYLMDLRGTAKLYDTIFTIGFPIRVNDNANVTFYGKTVINQPASNYGSGLVKVLGASKITLDANASITNNSSSGLFLSSSYYTDIASSVYDLKGTIDCTYSERAYNLFEVIGGTININGKINCPKGGINFNDGTVNINAISSIGRLYGHSTQTTNPTKHATANINAATTIDADNYEAVSMSFHYSQPDTLNINAPLTIINAKNDSLTDFFGNGMLSVNTINVNSDVDGGGGMLFTYIQPQQITFDAKSNIKNISRIYWKKQYSDVKLIYKTGARLTLGGVCKKVTADKTVTRKMNDATEDWRTPQSPFTGGC